MTDVLTDIDCTETPPYHDLINHTSDSWCDAAMDKLPRYSKLTLCPNCKASKTKTNGGSGSTPQMNILILLVITIYIYTI